MHGEFFVNQQRLPNDGVLEQLLALSGSFLFSSSKVLFSVAENSGSEINAPRITPISICLERVAYFVPLKVWYLWIPHAVYLAFDCRKLLSAQMKACKIFVRQIDLGQYQAHHWLPHIERYLDECTAANGGYLDRLVLPLLTRADLRLIITEVLVAFLRS